MNATRDDIERWAEAIVKNPVGYNFLAGAMLHDIAPSSMADPVFAMTHIGSAIMTGSQWSGRDPFQQPDDSYVYFEKLLPTHAEMCDYGKEMLLSDGADWWYESPSSDLQISARNASDSPAWINGDPEIPAEMEEWDSYRCMPTWALFTSSDMGGGLTSNHYGEANTIEDLGPLTGRVEVMRYEIERPCKRLYSVRTPDDWWRLCRSYPFVSAKTTSKTFPWFLPRDQSLMNNGVARIVVPDFTQMAEDWLGLNITYVGVLAASQIAIHLKGGRWSRFIGWDCEGTVWFRQPSHVRSQITLELKRIPHHPDPKTAPAGTPTVLDSVHEVE